MAAVRLRNVSRIALASMMLAGCGGRTANVPDDTAPSGADSARADTAGDEAVPAVDAPGDTAVAAEDGSVTTPCPPAPPEPDKLPKSCVYPQHCFYDVPAGLASPAGLGRSDPCNFAYLDCSSDGEYVIARTAVGCLMPVPPACPEGLVEGAPCIQKPRYEGGLPSNGECFIPSGAPKVDRSIDGQACACDVPGPMWRCISGTYYPPGS